MELVKITEVGPRDGLQNEKTILSTQDKFEFISRLVETGVKHMELTSFVRKDRIPQMGDAKELAALVLPKFQNKVRFSSLTPNAKGYEGAKEAGFPEVAVFTATSETFTKKNINMTIEESLDFFKPIFTQAKTDGIKVRGYISTVIACPYEGKIKPEKTLNIAERLLDAGVYEISLGETIGVAVPSEVESLLEVLFKKIPKTLLAGHFHDTYGMAIANTKQALGMGIRSFDSSAGGLGGCPYAKGAAGNVATEDLVYFLHREGYDTGIQLDSLVSASRFMEEKIGRKLTSRTYVAMKNAD
ncbi:hydroxymethylglutaryl-CoA lyase [Leptospira congkakensis]|uniref:Hydroxymethylglutaryl-CoA lyase n=1 Tax=Leptospira congkakensis TaxID=2484932 RepID=A0A4Z1A5N2_9LEPT|nr:hydroxymethylglutaryl-CoA lyase [Leptospira congkakensis]TGL90310.1 hydroxymethylglutaryl-CoA lyase [Leptospira congkakensis]TGL91317.1 hydroxymethylglutaryl-CoA lyase [Leptospira congkakensis]TGL98369.1 hydroxymethylglutaryl-CoA lyase [Leptospira congkakensis]